jgi:hypothetical protein
MLSYPGLTIHRPTIMNRILPLLCLVLPIAVSVLAACGHRQPEAPPLVSNGFTLNPEPWLDDQKKITQRASFDLNCPAEKIETTVLAVGGNGMYFDDWATQVGAAGCDQRAVYIRTPQGWLANIAGADSKPK